MFISVVVTDEGNDFLCKIPQLEEVKTAVFDLDATSAPGPNGFGGSFYHACWSIIAVDLVTGIFVFFTKGWIL